MNTLVKNILGAALLFLVMAAPVVLACSGKTCCVACGTFC
jgi:hypothetical protein